jgi:hypothetical protein
VADVWRRCVLRSAARLVIVDVYITHRHDPDLLASVCIATGPDRIDGACAVTLADRLWVQVVASMAAVTSTPTRTSLPWMRPGLAGVPLGGDPLPLLFGGRFPVRGDRIVSP